MNRKIKIGISLSVLSGVILSSNLQVKSMIRKGISNLSGVASRAARNLSGINVRESQGQANLSSSSRVNGSRNLAGVSYSKFSANKQNERTQEQLRAIIDENTMQTPKVGIFQTNEGAFEPLVLTKRVNDEGIEFEELNLKDGFSSAVTSFDGKYYSPVLTSTQVYEYDDNNEGAVRKAYDTLGRVRNVIVTDGQSEDIAYQLDLGIFRSVNEGEDGKIYLGHAVNINDFSEDVKNNVNSLVYDVSNYATAIKVEKDEAYVQPKIVKEKKSVEKEIKLPVLTTSEIKKIESSDPTKFQKILDKTGNEKSVVVLKKDSDGKKLAYVLESGNFYDVGLSRKKKLILGEEVDKSKVSQSLKEKVQTVLSDVGSTPTLLPISQSISVPKLTPDQLQTIKNTDPNKVEKLKDYNGVDVDVILVGNDREGFLAFNPLVGTVHGVRVSKKGNKIIEKEVNVSSLSQNNKNELENLFSSLNIGYTRRSDSATGSSQIVAGARRKTGLVKKSETSQTPVPPQANFVGKGIVLNKDGFTENLDVYNRYTLDGIEVNYAFKDGEIIKVAHALDDRYVASAVLTPQEVEAFKVQFPGEVVDAIDGLGVSHPVITLKLSNSKFIAYQMDEGVFRHLSKSRDKWNLTGIFDISTLPDKDQTKALDILIVVGHEFDRD